MNPAPADEQVEPHLQPAHSVPTRAAASRQRGARPSPMVTWRAATPGRRRAASASGATTTTQGPSPVRSTCAQRAEPWEPESAPEVAQGRAPAALAAYCSAVLQATPSRLQRYRQRTGGQPDDRCRPESTGGRARGPSRPYPRRNGSPRRKLLPNLAQSVVRQRSAEPAPEGDRSRQK